MGKLKNASPSKRYSKISKGRSHLGATGANGGGGGNIKILNKEDVMM